MLGFVAIPIIGLIPYFTDQRISTSLLYLIPILIVTVTSGFSIGLIAAVFASGLWFFTDLWSPTGDGRLAIPVWNAFMRLGTFTIAVSLISALKSMNQTLEERVVARTRELKSKLDENSMLERKILEVSDKEQSRIGQDLHDGLGQQLVSVAFSLNMIREKVEGPERITEVEIASLQDIVDNAISQARNLARGLFPVSLESEGLEIAIRELAGRVTDRFKLPCRVEFGDGVPAFGSDVSSQLYRIAQEAVTNAVKHAGASTITITFQLENGHYVLRVIDDGKGAPRIPTNPDGMGRRIMAYRARMIRAQIRFQSAHQGSGHSVICEMPAGHF